MKKIYIAAPLFTPQERALNERLERYLSKVVETFLPQRDGVLIPGQRNLSAEDFRRLSRNVFVSDIGGIQWADCILAVLDGRTIDEGVAFELGYAHALGKTCIGFRTDARSLLPHGNNPMIEQCLTLQFGSEEELVIWLSNQLPAGAQIMAKPAVSD